MKSVFSVFRKGLQKTATSVTRNISSVFSDIAHWDEETYEELEAALIGADFGVEISLQIVDDLRDRYSRGLIKSSEDIRILAKSDIVESVSKYKRDIDINPDGPTVILFAGVNGSGKTTSIGKLGHQWIQEGKKLVYAACDTFRAAAVEQIKHWGERTGAHVISSVKGADPSAVAYDAVESAIARNADFLLIDTAGRQHTKKGLMDELKKMSRTIDKVLPGAPHESWLTVDASTGTNALFQAREFSKAADLTGLILTKLDGTGKGGVVVAIQNELEFPVFFTGFGEQPDDMQLFDPEYYADAVFELSPNS